MCLNKCSWERNCKDTKGPCAGMETTREWKNRSLVGWVTWGREVWFSLGLDFGGLGKTALPIYSPDLQPQPAQKGAQLSNLAILRSFPAADSYCISVCTPCSFI